MVSFGFKGHSGKMIFALVLVLIASIVAPVMAEEEEKPSKMNVSIAATLIGSISFIMLLYYFINYDDEDVKEQSWQIINSTISIFIAVLCFSSFNDLAEAYLIDPLFGEDLRGAMLVDFGHMMFWFTVMQVSLANLSGAAGCMAADTEAFEKLDEEEKEEVMEGKEVNMACYAVLSAHVTGFASGNFFSTVQQYFFSASWYHALCAPLVCLIFMLVLQRITDAIRVKISMGDDGEEDEFEKMWDEECEEAENDVMGLALSGTTVAALRFMVDECLPNQEGKLEGCREGLPEPYLFNHTFHQKMSMISAGFLFAVVIFVMRSRWPEWLEGAEIKKLPKSQRHRAQLIARLAEGIYVAVSMCFSWSMFYGFQETLGNFAMFTGNDELLAVVNALVLSLLCMFMIIPLDWLADQSWTDEKCDTAIRSIMAAMGILIGFGWEQCFDASVDAIAAKSDDSSIEIVNPHTSKLALTAFCVAILMPAWKWYILPFIVSKGWESSYPLRMADKLARLVEEDNLEELNEEDGASKKAHLDLMEKIGKKIASTATEKLEKVKGKKEDGGGDAYTELAGDDIEALKKQVVSLRGELKGEKDKRVQAQNMLDDTLQKMMGSMKSMHTTVSRIEASGSASG